MREFLYAVMDGDQVENVIIGASADDATPLSLMLGKDVVLVDESTGPAVPGSDRLDGKFRPLKKHVGWRWDPSAWDWVPPTPQPSQWHLWDNTSRDWVQVPSPYESWVWDESTLEYLPPTPRPTDGTWFWDEDTLSWVEVTA